MPNVWTDSNSGKLFDYFYMSQLSILLYLRLFGLFIVCYVVVAAVGDATF